MSLQDRVQFRSGYVISLDAWKRYFAEGHGARLRCDYPHTTGTGDNSGEEEEEEEEEQEKKDNGMSDEEREMLQKEMSDWDRGFHYTGAFRGLYRRQAVELRVQLVLPHAFDLALKHAKYGEVHKRGVFIPTGSGGPFLRTKGPSEVDRERIRSFIDIANRLISDEVRRERGGFHLGEPDVKFEVMPEWAIIRPQFSDKELKDLVKAGPDAMRLYGISVPEFLRPYRN